MSFSTIWDVNKYYDPAEFNEHWILRKEFMLTHKTKFPENRLAGLAKIFHNMEFLGCVYNSELMILVQNLAEQVDAIVQYRDRKKMKLQRTFVKASDAVKKHINQSNVNSSKIQYVNFVTAKNDDNDDEEESKRLKIDEFINRPELEKYKEKITNPGQSLIQPEPAFIQTGQQYLRKNQFMPEEYQQPKQQFQQFQSRKPDPLEQKFETLSKTQQNKLFRQQLKTRNQRKDKYQLRFDVKPEDRELIMKVKSQNGVLGKLVLFETQIHKSPFGNLDYSASKVNINMKILKDEINKKYILYMDDEHICEIPIIPNEAVNSKLKGNRKFKIPEDIRNELSVLAIAHFKKYCFTIIDHNNKDCEAISSDNLKTKSTTSKPQIELSMDGIGAKMMKQMGWGGQGLGKNANGIVEPIQAEIRLSRRGFGQGSDQAFIKSVKDYLEKYLMSGETKRLVFSTDFSKEDRAKLHSVAMPFGLLRSKSYGKGDDRYFTIERKLSGWDIIEQLLANGGSNDSYTLIYPTNI